MKIFKKWQTYLILGIIGFLGFCAVPKCTEVTEHRYNKPIPLPKVTEVKKRYVKPEIKPNIPVKKKKVYIKKDTALRSEVEKKDIILAIKIVDNQIIEAVIDTSGQITENVLAIPIEVKGEIKELVIAPEGVDGKERTKAGKLLYKIGKGAKKAGTVVIVGLAIIGGVVVVLLASGN